MRGKKCIPVQRLRRMFDQQSYSAVAVEVQRHFYVPILYRPNMGKIRVNINTKTVNSGSIRTAETVIKCKNGYTTITSA